MNQYIFKTTIGEFVIPGRSLKSALEDLRTLPQWRRAADNLVIDSIELVIRKPIGE